MELTAQETAVVRNALTLLARLLEEVKGTPFYELMAATIQVDEVKAVIAKIDQEQPD